MTIPRRMLFWILAAVVAVALVVLANRPDPAPVDLAEVVRGPLRVTLDQEGRTRVQERFVLTAPANGRLLRIELEPGDPVEAGEVVATFAPAAAPILDHRSRRAAAATLDAARAGLARAQAERAAAVAAAERAQQELAHQRRLADAGVVPPDAVDAAATAAVRARELALAAAAAERTGVAEVAIAEAALAGEGELSTPTSVALRAPATGLVLTRHRESETVVAAGEPLLEIGDLSKLEVMADYLSTDAVQIQPGMPVSIERWGGEGSLLGRVRRVEPGGFVKISALGVEEQRVWVVVELTSPLELRPSLGDGYRVETRVVLVDRDDVLLVPTGALVRQGNDWSVFVVADGIARQQLVQLGDRAPFAAEVLGGLEVGDQVVLHPTDRVVDGVKVRERG
jgi:HlyD family secretion protein